MRRFIFTAFLVAGLLLQGAVAATAQVLPEEAASSHCAGSAPTADDGECCDDAMSNGCAAHCQVAESPSVLVLAESNFVSLYRLAANDRANPNPDYAPDLRPPIA